MKFLKANIIIYLLSLFITLTSHAQGALPSDLISQAILKNKTVLHVKIKETTDADLAKYLKFFSDSQLEKINFTKANVVAVLNAGDLLIKANQQILFSESSSKTYYYDQHDYGNNPEYEIISSPFLEEGAEYLYILGEEQTYRRTVKKEKAVFKVYKDFEGKGILKIVPDGKKGSFIPQISKSELEEIKKLMNPVYSKGKQTRKMSLSKPQFKTKFAEILANKLETGR